MFDLSSEKVSYFLCISKMPGAKKKTVKIFCSTDVPAKWEELIVLQQYETKKLAEEEIKRWA